MNKKEIRKMSKHCTNIGKALQALDGRVGKILDIYVDGNVIDVIGTTGGDEVHYRVRFENEEVISIGCK